MNKTSLLLGDCLQTLKTLPDNSVDSVVTDPPYGLSFMGKKWDYDVPSTEIWKEALRVLKPGGHLLAFFGTRTYHRGVVRIEDAGFEIRDQLAWIYSTGFPKSLNIAKAALKSGDACGCSSQSKSPMPSVRNAGVSAPISVSAASEDSLQSGMPEQNLCASDSEAVPFEGTKVREEPGLEGRGNLQAHQGELHRTEVRSMPSGLSSDGKKRRVRDGASSCDGDASESLSHSNGSSPPQRPQHAKQSDRESGTIRQQSTTQTCGSCGEAIIDSGLGTALKPAQEPIVVARKPISESTIAKNVLTHGTGALNIDASRIEGIAESPGTTPKTANGNGQTHGAMIRADFVPNTQGRWPANVLFDEEAAKVLDEQSGPCKTGGAVLNANRTKGTTFDVGTKNVTNQNQYANGSGGASRFFYVAKASKRERNAGLNPSAYKPLIGETGDTIEMSPVSVNGHPTVKPIKLMQYLIKMVTPQGGTLLDPFMGSGSTGVAAVALGFDFIGCELSEEYMAIAKKRITHAQNQTTPEEIEEQLEHQLDLLADG
jgi:DNA modification methylase